MLLALAVLSFGVALLFGGCKKATQAKPAQTGQVVSRVQGLWTSACQPLTAGSSRLVEMTISKDEIFYFQYEYSDASCQAIRGRVSVSTPYLPLAADDELGRLDIVTQPRSAVVKPASAAELSRLQQNKLCGSETWSNSSEKNVSMTLCGDAFLDAAKLGNVESFAITSSDELSLGNAPLRFRRKPATKKAGQSGFQLTERKKTEIYLADAYLPPERRKKYDGEISFNFTPEAFQVQACADKPTEACGEFTPDMRAACAYCGGGIDTCQTAKRWALNFTQAIVTQLQTWPPGGVCKPPGAEAGVRDPGESHDEHQAAAESEIAEANNQRISGSSTAVQVEQQQQGQPRGQPQGQPANGVSPEQERLKQRKEQIAAATGFGAGFLIPTGGKVVGGLVGSIGGPPGAVLGFLAGGAFGLTVGAATSRLITHATGTMLDMLMPTPEADAVRRNPKPEAQPQQ